MEKTKGQSKMKIYRNIIRWILLIFSIVVFTYSLFSSLISTDSSIKGLINNTPDNFTWLILLGINWIVWKSELTGSIILAIFAIVSGMLNNAFTDNSFLLYTVIIPIFIISILLIHYHFLIVKQKKNAEGKKERKF